MTLSRFIAILEHIFDEIGDAQVMIPNIEVDCDGDMYRMYRDLELDDIDCRPRIEMKGSVKTTHVPPRVFIG